MSDMLFFTRKFTKGSCPSNVQTDTFIPPCNTEDGDSADLLNSAPEPAARPKISDYPAVAQQGHLFENQLYLLSLPTEQLHPEIIKLQKLAEAALQRSVEEMSAEDKAALIKSAPYLRSESPKERLLLNWQALVILLSKKLSFKNLKQNEVENINKIIARLKTAIRTDFERRADSDFSLQLAEFDQALYRYEYIMQLLAHFAFQAMEQAILNLLPGRPLLNLIKAALSGMLRPGKLRDNALHFYHELSNGFGWQDRCNGTQSFPDFLARINNALRTTLAVSALSAEAVNLRPGNIIQGDAIFQGGAMLLAGTALQVWISEIAAEKEKYMGPIQLTEAQTLVEMAQLNQNISAIINRVYLAISKLQFSQKFFTIRKDISLSAMLHSIMGFTQSGQQFSQEFVTTRNDFCLSAIPHPMLRLAQNNYQTDAAMVRFMNKNIDDDIYTLEGIFPLVPQHNDYKNMSATVTQHRMDKKGYMQSLKRAKVNISSCEKMDSISPTQPNSSSTQPDSSSTALSVTIPQAVCSLDEQTLRNKLQAFYTPTILPIFYPELKEYGPVEERNLMLWKYGMKPLKTQGEHDSHPASSKTGNSEKVSTKEQDPTLSDFISDISHYIRLTVDKIYHYVPPQMPFEPTMAEAKAMHSPSYSEKEENIRRGAEENDQTIRKVPKDYTCITERNKADFPTILRIIGQTIQLPVTNMVKESQIIHFYNKYNRCPTQDEINNIIKYTETADSSLNLALSLIPGGGGLSQGAPLAGKGIELIADLLDGTEVSSEELIDDSAQLHALSHYFEISQDQKSILPKKNASSAKNIIMQEGDKKWTILHKNQRLFAMNGKEFKEINYDEKGWVYKEAQPVMGFNKKSEQVILDLAVSPKIEFVSERKNQPDVYRVRLQDGRIIHCAKINKYLLPLRMSRHLNLMEVYDVSHPTKSGYPLSKSGKQWEFASQIHPSISNGDTADVISQKIMDTILDNPDLLEKNAVNLSFPNTRGVSVAEDGRRYIAFREGDLPIRRHPRLTNVFYIGETNILISYSKTEQKYILLSEKGRYVGEHDETEEASFSCQRRAKRGLDEEGNPCLPEVSQYLPPDKLTKAPGIYDFNRGMTAEEYQSRRNALEADANTFFQNVAIPERPVLAGIEPGVAPEYLFREVYKENDGVALGDYHQAGALGDRSTICFYQLIKDTSPLLKELEVKTIFLENILADDEMAVEIRQAFLSGQKLNRQLLSSPGPVDNALCDLIDEAHRMGIAVVPVDNKASLQINYDGSEGGLAEILAKKDKGELIDQVQLQEEKRRRLRLFNYYSSAVINEKMTGKTGKWLLIAGVKHLKTHHGVPGVANIKKAVAIEFKFDASAIFPEISSDAAYGDYQIKASDMKLAHIS